MSHQSATTHDPRYPVGKFIAPESITAEDLRYAMASIAEMPELLRDSIRSLKPGQINTPYREGGWTVRQVIHHVADSHMTAFHRLQRALTEDWPVVHDYNEAAFATLHDVSAPVEWSLELIEGVHARWVMLLQSLTPEQWKRGYNHTVRGMTGLEVATLSYGWHSRHHVAHITHLRALKGW
jgi:hypothetical protein